MSPRSPLARAIRNGMTLAALAWSCACGASPAHAATCSTSEAGYPGAGPWHSGATDFDQWRADSAYHVAFDLAEGLVAVKHGGGLGQTYVTGRDLFDVTGVPAGTVVDLWAELWVDGEILSYGCGGSGCQGILDFSLTSGGVTNSGSIVRTIFSPGSEEVHGGIPLPVTITAGQPVLVEYVLRGRRSAGGNHGARGTGRLRFSSVPEGAGIVSCQGYSQVPVPARQSSWGRVKTLYR